MIGRAARPSAAGDLLWVAAAPAGRHAPLWRALGEHQQLTVALLHDTEPNGLRRTGGLPYAVVRLTPGGWTGRRETGPPMPFLGLLALIQSRPRAVVLDAWDSPALLAARWWGRRCGVPMIASCGSDLGPARGRSILTRVLRRWFFRGADLVLTCDARSTAAMVKFGVPRARVVESFGLADMEQFIAGRPVTHAR